jgi:hypothetical protein
MHLYNLSEELIDKLIQQEIYFIELSDIVLL